MAEEHAPLPSQVVTSGLPAPTAPRADTEPQPRPASPSLLYYLTLGFFGRPHEKPDQAAPPNYVSRIDGTREIVETVVFVVVLVLLLKSFVAEAFVIPTGSMATTLWGYQKIGKCDKCEHLFPVNCSQEVEPQKGHLPIPVTAAVCPNCRWILGQDVEVRDPHNGQRQVRRKDDALGTPNTGDRVLVAKFLYDLPWRTPQRLDVVVFKYPDKPQEYYIPLNYIKRLIGLGGETIAIFYGNLYVLDPDKSPTHEEDRLVPPVDLWRPDHMHRDDERALKLFEEGLFKILRKPPDKVLSTRRLVYDNDHPAKDLTNDPRWVGAADGATWSEVKASHGFKHTPVKQETAWLRYQHVLRGNNGKPSLITDFMGYNTAGGQTPPQHWVGDLILETEVTVDSANGQMAFELSRGVDRFRAVWDLATGECTLRHLNEEYRKKKANGQASDDENFAAGEKLESKATSLKKPGTYLVRFANVDDRLTVWVNGELPFGDGVAYTPAKEHGPTEENDLKQPASIAAAGAALSLAKLSLWRDTYYTSGVDERDQDWANPPWDDLARLPPKTLYVQPDHFLCMGDNSPQSSDSRMWGLVPRRLMLGRALVVYYPFHFPWWPFNSPMNRVGAIK